MRIPQLDGIRGVAILLVLVWHYSTAIPVEPATPLAYFLRLFALTWAGVDLFFVLSGFLIGGILIDSRDNPDYFRRFYLRRAVRILPLYFLMLAIGIATNASASYLNPAPPIGWFATFTQNIWLSFVAQQWQFWLAHTWSLAVEEQFYLFFPVVIFFAPRRLLLPILIGLAMSALAFRIGTVLLFDGWAIANNILLPARMDALLCGVICAMIVRQRTWNADWRRSAYAALAVLCAFAALGTARGWYQYTIPMATFGYSLMALLGASVILIAVGETAGVLARILSCAPLRRMGTLAYCVYLIHQPLMHFFIKAWGERWHAIAASFIFTIILSELSWRFFESPLLAIGHRWRTRTSYEGNIPRIQGGSMP